MSGPGKSDLDMFGSAGPFHENSKNATHGARKLSDVLAFVGESFAFYGFLSVLERQINA